MKSPERPTSRICPSTVIGLRGGCVSANAANATTAITAKVSVRRFIVAFSARGRARRRHKSVAPLFDEIRDESRPSRLMRGAEAFAGVAVEVFVEEHEVAPVRIVREQFCFARAGRAVDGTIPVAVG